MSARTNGGLNGVILELVERCKMELLIVVLLLLYLIIYEKK